MGSSLLTKINGGNSNTRKLCMLLLLPVLLGFLTGCKSQRAIPYFQDMTSLDKTKLNQVKYTEPTIISDDILDITIQTADANASRSINAAATDNSIVAPNVQARATGFVVDRNGEVELPILGKIKLEGLTSFEARNVIREKARKFFIEPTVQVRFVNFKVTVIGEVNRPSSYTMPSERVTILDALGLAGDLTIYGKRENVLLVRETTNGKEMVRFNLNNSEIFNSPYYYLKQNDIIYVEPSESKVAAADNAQLMRFSVAASVLSALAIIANLII
ncbi:polysaccharide biosynthesis/export family protein [Olivibacter sp. XZL3]|uniref:polysaccharide biosynthesis/export family protein n=1 Tax=Olivibacter sp. XZL3 TaxID=1735116 RepID=UPI001F0D0176|nr:polysaccharide biosynthesis/export family protein [Olivibacter sp. XZL3]